MMTISPLQSICVFVCVHTRTYNNTIMFGAIQREVSPRTSGRLSHSSGPLNGGSLTDSAPLSPSDFDD